MDITSYTDLLNVARMQNDAQRLLFVFTAAELPEEHGPAQKDAFLAGQGGALVPVMCVDKLPDELGNFDALVTESQKTGASWDIVFISAMSGVLSLPPSSDEAEHPLLMMVESIKNGRLSNMLAFDRSGDPVQFF